MCTPAEEHWSASVFTAFWSTVTVCLRLKVYSLLLPHLVLILIHPRNQTCFPWNFVRAASLLGSYTSTSRQPHFSNFSDEQWGYRFKGGIPPFKGGTPPPPELYGSSKAGDLERTRSVVLGNSSPLSQISYLEMRHIVTLYAGVGVLAMPWGLG